MKVPFIRRRGVDRSRGQAMVEFALVLPVLAILLVMAIDFGRVYFGWVGLQNVARIAANYAGAHPDGWDPNYPNTPLKQALVASYYTQVAQDAANLNCSPLPRVSPTVTYMPIPSFIDTNGNGRYELGEQVSVTLNCSFGLITPLANSIVGGGVNLSALAVFPVRAGAIAGIPISSGSASPTPTSSPSPTPTASASSSASASASASASPPCPLPIANFVASPTSTKKNRDIQFTDTSQTFGCSVSGRLWDFGDGVTSTLPNPVHQYGSNGNYDVTLTVTSPGGTNSTRVAGYITICPSC
jgi:Flp pilus assembly protein TadG